jgi:hypothetical protein
MIAETLPVILVDFHGDLLNSLMLEAMNHGLVEKQNALEFSHGFYQAEFLLTTFFVESTIANAASIVSYLLNLNFMLKF